MAVIRRAASRRTGRPRARIDFMDSQQIATGILSVSTPSVVGWAQSERREMARRINEYTADLVADRPERFGSFATLPLPDVDGAVEEVGLCAGHAARRRRGPHGQLRGEVPRRSGVRAAVGRTRPPPRGRIRTSRRHPRTATPPAGGGRCPTDDGLPVRDHANRASSSCSTASWTGIRESASSSRTRAASCPTPPFASPSSRGSSSPTRPVPMPSWPASALLLRHGAVVRSRPAHPQGVRRPRPHPVRHRLPLRSRRLRAFTAALDAEPDR